MSNEEKTWKNIFEDVSWVKSLDNISDYSITTLLELNGHTVSKTGSYDLNKWMETVNHIKKNINYNENVNNTIVEIGCGAGALLKMFENNSLIGIEPSNTYTKIVKKALPNALFINGDALKIEKIKNESVDIILSHSCIQYFPDISYFKRCLDLIHDKLKKGGNISLTDLCDKDKKELCLNYRKQQLGEEKYKELYSKTNLKHFYISRNEILDLVKYKFKNVVFTDAVKRGDENDFYRFNFFAEKI